MAISVRVTPEEAELIKNYASEHGMSVSEAMRNAIFSAIEDAEDVEAVKTACAEYQQSHISYSLADVEKMYGIR